MSKCAYNIKDSFNARLTCTEDATETVNVRVATHDGSSFIMQFPFCPWHAITMASADA